MNGVVSVFPSRILHLHTTRSWDFMGFNESTSRKRDINIIVGVINGGIWPESDSFSDEGFGPPPEKWKGACSGGKNFTCDNKIIGARYYNSSASVTSARDEDGHGSHTASTAAGNLVKDASFYGLAKGTARGGIPSARIAAYKVCDAEGCPDADILSAFDDAIADGVDLITISIGKSMASKLNEDAIAISAFHAMTKGILTVNSAGNGGRNPESVSSVAPWMFSVAACTTDRRIVDNIILGNGETVVVGIMCLNIYIFSYVCILMISLHEQGTSINIFSFGGKKLPLVLGKEVVKFPNCSTSAVAWCYPGCIDGRKAKGKIVICYLDTGYPEVHRAGAAGSIMNNDVFGKRYPVVSIPASVVTSEEYNAAAPT
ncbi:hypothetical protein Ddye_018157 [Dipteronia dyeriana]|uniref:Peptidase S8/S53 domain-containing protein n=1 Tax=Dipteronia dyeriana TaxID=168575 RepID=A0AAD9UAK5_9ROSI|nr:hypothetical protein Ddye_018157 [Dipteronia dyeriana]